MAEPRILLARQPIYDLNQDVIAYELLFRPIEHLVEGIQDGDAATSEVITHAFAEIGIDKLIGNTSAFINYTRKWIVEPPEFETDRLVIEVLENIKMDDEVNEKLCALKQRGFQIALDDFTALDKQYIPALHVVDFVKVDLLSVPEAELVTLVEQLKSYNVKLIAEKVETHEQFDFCKKLGFDYFQGYFLCRPENIHGKKTESNKLLISRLLGALRQPGIGVNELHEIISKEPVLSYKLMRVVNSPAFYFDRPIDSLLHALSILGVQQIQCWASLIALTNLDDKPNELLIISMTRAKMCELISTEIDLGIDDSMFTIGLFSSLDAFLDRELEEILAELPLNKTAKEALMTYTGREGKILQCAINHQIGNWEDIDWSYLEELGVNATVIERCYLESLKWAKETFNTLLNKK